MVDNGTTEVAKSPTGAAPKDNGSAVDPAIAELSTYNQEGAMSMDQMATREVIKSGQLPLDYQYDEKQMMANTALAISSDIADFTEEDLMKDETWNYSSKKMYNTLMGEEFSGTDQEAAQYGIDLMRKVENNMVSLGSFAGDTANMSSDDAKTALYMMDMFEAKEFTWKGFGEAMGYAGIDPANYLVGATMGYAFTAKTAAKTAAKTGIRKSLEALAYKRGMAGGIEGAAYGGAYEHYKQSIGENAGQDYEVGSVLANVAIGGAFGAAGERYLPEVFEYATDKGMKWLKSSSPRAEIEAAANLGDPEAIQLRDDMYLLGEHYGIKDWLEGGVRLAAEKVEKSPFGRMVKTTNNIIANDGNAMPISDFIASTNGMNPKKRKGMLSAAMRNATPQERVELIAAMKADAPIAKPKTPKAIEKINEREEFSEHFYSKLDHEINKIPEEYIKYLKKNGVKQDEIDASGIMDLMNEYSSTYVTGGGIRDRMIRHNQIRPDKIQKRTYTEEDFGGSEGIIDQPTYEGEWITQYDNEEIGFGDTGVGTRVTDDYTGSESIIAYNYDGEIYVDDYGTEFSYDEMIDNYVTDYGDDVLDRVRDDHADEIAAGDMDENDIYDKAIEIVSNDDLYQDYYNAKQMYVTEGGSAYDDLDDAVAATQEMLYDYYVERADMDGANGGNSFEDYTVNGGEDYKMEVYQMEDFISSKDLHEEPHLGEDYSNDMEFGYENVQVHSRMKTRTDADGKTGQVLEEVQSQWEQDWRGKGGGIKAPTDEAVEQANDQVIAAGVEMAKVEEKINDSKARAKDISDTQEAIRLEYRDKNLDLEAEIEVLDVRAKELRDKSLHSRSTQERAELLKTENRAEDLENELEKKSYREDPEYKKLDEDYSKIKDERLALSQERRAVEDSIKPAQEVLSWKEPEIATPPIQNRTQYEKIVLLDNMTAAVKNGDDYFGWINGHIQNGNTTPSSQLTGMTQAYDREMPRIIQKATGKTPYMASFKDGMPVKVAGDDEFTGKIYWNKDDIKDQDHFDNMTNDKWYWRVDLDDEVQAKLKDAKIQMYGIGGATLIGAEAMNGEDNAREQ